jgi:hypothetical protein
MDTPAWKADKQTRGDAAVDGLLSGVAAGLVMAVVLVGLGVLRGIGWLEILGQFDPSISAQPFVGVLTHLAVSGVYGAIFGVLWRLGTRRLPGLPTWLAGLLFGLGLWLVAITLTAARGAADGGWLAGIPPADFALAHGLYGLALGWLSARVRAREAGSKGGLSETTT